MSDFDWLDTSECLRRLSTHPQAGKIFGADSHLWLMQPPLTMEELAEAESQLGVQLPGEYRSFLLQVGRGGAGPAYGLFPLRRTDGDGIWRWEGDGADLTDRETLAQPFTHTDAFNPADGLPARPAEEGFDSVEAFNEAEDAYGEQHDAVVCAPEHSLVCSICVTSDVPCARLDEAERQAQDRPSS